MSLKFYGEPIRRQVYNKEPEAAAVSASIEHMSQEKKFFINNVENHKDLNIDAPSLHYTVTRTETPNRFQVSYKPQEKEHDVIVTYKGNHVEGSPFMLAPSKPYMEFDHPNKHITFNNISDVSKLDISSKYLNYELFEDPTNSKTFHMQYNPLDEMHDVEVSYNGKAFENGIFRLVPEADKERYNNSKVEVVDGQPQFVQEETPIEESMNQMSLHEPNQELNAVPEFGEIVAQQHVKPESHHMLSEPQVDSKFNSQLLYEHHAEKHGQNQSYNDDKDKTQNKENEII